MLSGASVRYDTADLFAIRYTVNFWNVCNNLHAIRIAPKCTHNTLTLTHTHYPHPKCGLWDAIGLQWYSVDIFQKQLSQSNNTTTLPTDSFRTIYFYIFQAIERCALTIQTHWFSACIWTNLLQIGSRVYLKLHKCSAIWIKRPIRSSIFFTWSPPSLNVHNLIEYRPMANLKMFVAL